MRQQPDVWNPGRCRPKPCIVNSWRVKVFFSEFIRFGGWKTFWRGSSLMVLKTFRWIIPFPNQWFPWKQQGTSTKSEKIQQGWFVCQKPGRLLIFPLLTNAEATFNYMSFRRESSRRVGNSHTLTFFFKESSDKSFVCSNLAAFSAVAKNILAFKTLYPLPWLIKLFLFLAGTVVPWFFECGTQSYKPILKKSPTRMGNLPMLASL